MRATPRTTEERAAGTEMSVVFEMCASPLKVRLCISVLKAASTAETEPEKVMKRPLRETLSTGRAAIGEPCGDLGDVG